ncbi:MAG: mannose-1-phosphate guanylyltransferase/mannose-6-phosphate isomerase [Comamonadaceae bacterium]|nr:MAG: mannose-1-phosphate guanylyltransferase/mannose-6-phosphate isomerase [Comamonadaceae bacterium]
MPMVPLILCGGSGSRLWPLSSDHLPKPFHALCGERTLFQRALALLDGYLPASGEAVQPPLVLAGEAHRFVVAAQLQASGPPGARILLEPEARGTAAALAAAALHLRAEGADPVLLALPADHVFEDAAAFHRVLDAAQAAALAGRLVIFGVTPTTPEAGYGYLRVPERAAADAAPAAMPVEAFIEKPPLADAQRFVADGRHLWNSGILMVRASVLLQELALHAPQVLAAARAAVQAACIDPDFVRLDAAAFAAAPLISIDCAVLERSARVSALALDAGWSDVGTWQGVWQASAHDAQGNAVAGDVRLQSVTRSHVQASHRHVAVLGLHDVVVVETADAVLVASMAQAQQVRALARRFDGPAAATATAPGPLREQRPWGYFEVLESGPRHKVKRLCVAPGACLSLQLHHHRSEHWIVVSGTARVRVGEREWLLAENESAFVPAAVAHRLHNPGRIPLQIIEVQTGAYVQEDDIVRLAPGGSGVVVEAPAPAGPAGARVVE